MNSSSRLRDLAIQGVVILGIICLWKLLVWLFR